MDRDQLIAEIKKQLQEELKAYARPLTDRVSAEHQDQIQELHGELTAAMKDHPWAAFGVAVVAGYFMGRILHKRSQD